MSPTRVRSLLFCTLVLSLCACSDEGSPKTESPAQGIPAAGGGIAPPPGAGGNTPNAPAGAPAAGTTGTSTSTAGSGPAQSGGSGAMGGGGGGGGGAGTTGPAAGATAEPMVDAGAMDPTPDAGGTGEPEPMDEDCEGDAESEFALVGWATQSGGTTGGRGGMTIDVSSGAALAQALKDKQDSAQPLTIRLSGTITAASAGVEKFEVKDVQDVSILGMGGGAELSGIGIKIVRASNIVIRNLKIHDVATGDKDAISIEGPADHIWIDHCELYAEYEGVDKDFYDGLLDAKAETQYLTYSWNSFHDSWKTMLVGSSEDDTFDRKLTIHHNLFRNCNSRMPLFRGGNGHVFNNYYEGVADTGINSRIGACLLIEANVFVSSKNPWVSAFSDELGAAQLRCNVTDAASTFDFRDDVHEVQACTAQVPYAYDDVLNLPTAVKTVVTAGAGVGKLTNPEDY